MTREPPSEWFILITGMIAIMALTVAAIAIQRHRPGALGVLVFALLVTATAGAAGAWRYRAARK